MSDEGWTPRSALDDAWVLVDDLDARRLEAIRRITTGLDIPPEMVQSQSSVIDVLRLAEYYAVHETDLPLGKVVIGRGLFDRLVELYPDETWENFLPVGRATARTFPRPGIGHHEQPCWCGDTTHR